MPVTLTSEQIVIDRIKIPRDRKFDECIVRELMVSISLLGLLEPILLQRPAMGMGVILICGLNRLEACRRLKMRAILARVVNGNTPEINSWCEKAELDENNVRRIGSPPSGSNVVPLMTARG